MERGEQDGRSEEGETSLGLAGRNRTRRAGRHLAMYMYLSLCLCASEHVRHGVSPGSDTCGARSVFNLQLSDSCLRDDAAPMQLPMSYSSCCLLQTWRTTGGRGLVPRWYGTLKAVVVLIPDLSRPGGWLGLAGRCVEQQSSCVQSIHCCGYLVLNQHFVAAVSVDGEVLFETVARRNKRQLKLP